MKKTSFVVMSILAVFLVLVSGCANQPATQPAPVQQQIVVATCTDGIMNQGEIGIDCGGSCKSCNSPQETVTPEVTQPKEEPKPQPIVYTVTESQIADLKLKLAGQKSAFFVNAYPSGLNVGQSYVFAYGINNIMSEERQFSFAVEFKDARDTYTNPIEGTDTATIVGWTKDNQLNPVTLVKNGQAYIPIGVTVGNKIGSNKATVAGVYYFYIITKYKDGNSIVDYDKKEFSVRVK